MGLIAWLTTCVSKRSGRGQPGSEGNEKVVLAQLKRLRAVLEPAFSPETASPRTSAAGRPPSAGHCAAVAAIVWQRLGGELVSAKVQGESHWFNRLGIGGRVIDVDLTGDQFGLLAVRVGDPGRLHPGTRPRTSAELRDETIRRAIVLARRAGLDDTAERLLALLQGRVRGVGDPTDEKEHHAR
jgi:hypothetical protein